jgi:DNA-binding LacI/PurR family transcriptional regulator
MSTVLDVARRAGVSTATVSRVLSGGATVSGATRARVMAAVAESGFQINPLAQALRRGRASSVALLVGDIEQGLYSTLTRHLQVALGEIGLDLVLYNLGHSTDRLIQMLQRAEAMQLRGVAIATTDVLPLRRVAPSLQALTQSGVAVIAVGQVLAVEGVTAIVHEERAAAARAVAYLLERWGGPVAFLGRIAGSATGTARYEGYREALEAAGLTVGRDLVWDASFRYAAGHDALAAALGRGIRFRAVLAASDEMALGALGAIQDHGLRVPEDVAVMGFGNLEWGAYLRPALSTVSVHPEAIAALVKQILCAPLAAAPAALRRDLILRQSA